MCSGQTRRCAALAEEKQVKSGQTKASSLARVKRTSTRAPKDSDFSLVGPIEPHFVLREELTDSICAISVQRERAKLLWTTPHAHSVTHAVHLRMRFYRSSPALFFLPLRWFWTGLRLASSSYLPSEALPFCCCCHAASLSFSHFYGLRSAWRTVPLCSLQTIGCWNSQSASSSSSSQIAFYFS